MSIQILYSFCFVFAVVELHPQMIVMEGKVDWEDEPFMEC